jgi:hypothetical protein
MITIILLTTCVVNAQWVKLDTFHLSTVHGSSIAISNCLGVNKVITSRDSGLFLSNDEGVTWNQFSTKYLGLPFQTCGCVILASTVDYYPSPYYLYQKQIYGTGNQGSWSKSGMPDMGVNIRSMTIINGKYWVAGGGRDNLYTITTNGISGSFVNVSGEGLPDQILYTPFLANSDTTEPVFMGLGRYFYQLVNIGTWVWNNKSVRVFPDSTINISCIIAKQKYLFVGGYVRSGVYMSVDSGKTWSARNNGLKSMGIRSLCIIGNDIYAGTDTSGVFMSSDLGANWSAINEGLPLMSGITSIVADDAYIFVTRTPGGSPSHVTLYRRSISEMVSVRDHQIEKPYISNATISNNHINFAIANTEHVIAKVYNLLGVEMTVVTNRVFASGTYNLTWNNKNIPFGCYIIKLQIGTRPYSKAVNIFK